MPKNNSVDGINTLFIDKKIRKEIQEKLPRLFKIAEIECSRAGKIGMEVGSMREKIIIAMFIHYFGSNNVNSDIPITQSEIDVSVMDENISIKTISKTGAVKVVWTVDALKAKIFVDNYTPSCNILLVDINWGKEQDSIFYIPLIVQQKLLETIGRHNYLNTPKAGTNPRGVEFRRNTLKSLMNDKDTFKLPISWNLDNTVDVDLYERWVQLWTSD
tara:strand:+ start:1103 stop:1750 length:648 start_codon:yes stop_codon:yes gene_type:complete